MNLLPLNIFIYVSFIITFLIFAISVFRKDPKKSKIVKPALIVAEAYACLMTAFDLSGLIDFGGLKNLPLFTTLIGGCVLLFFLFRQRIPEKYRRPALFSVKAFIICSACEIFIFNGNCAHLFFRDYDYTVLDMETAVTENFNVSTGKNVSAGHFSIEFNGIEKPVGTISVNALSNTKGYVDMTIDMSDDSNSAGYRYGIATSEILRGNERSQTCVCNFSGNVHDLKLEFDTEESETVTVTSVTLNKPFMLHFSLMRFLCIFIAALLIWLFARSKTFAGSYRESEQSVKVCAIVLTTVLLSASLILADIGRPGGMGFFDEFRQKSGNQITQELVDSFEAGRTDIDIEMNPALEELENPYDLSQRDANNIGAYPWDHLYYNGKYYSYYGIAPVLFLFLPYHMMTGCYFPAIWAIWLFGAGGILFLTLFYLCFMKKFFPDVRSSVVVLCLIIMQCCSGIFFCFNLPNFYEIAQSCGFLCVTAGAYFLISSNVIGDGKISYGKLFTSGVFLSLAVLSRPTTAVYCVAAMIFVLAGFLKKRREKTAKSGSKSIFIYLPYFLCALIPYVIFGSVQMLYNYARFGSPFDFGIEYSLTINDFTSAEYHTHFAVIGFLNYLFMLPKVSENFPFIIPESPHTFSPQGYYYVATGSALGLLWKALPLLSYAGAHKAYRLSDNKNKKLYAVMLATVCVICPFVVIFSIWESGYGARYCVDFAWEMIIGALIIAFIIYRSCEKQTKKLLNIFMVATAAISVYLNMAQIWDWVGIRSFASPESQASALAIARLFEFWR